MSSNAPHTISVKRKRKDAPVQSLVLDPQKQRKKRSTDTPGGLTPTGESPTGEIPDGTNLSAAIESSSLKRKIDLPEREAKKRLTGIPAEGTVVWRLIKSVRTSSFGQIQPSAGTPPAQTPTPTRRFHISRATGNVVLHEAKNVESDEKQATAQNETTDSKAPVAAPAVTQPQATPPRKRPGAGSALPKRDINQQARTFNNGPSEDVMRQFEQFSQEVETGKPAECPKSPIKSPSGQIKPITPKRRYKDRHPEYHPDAMEVDGDEYVYDTYVREIIMPDADGKVPEPEGTVGYIVLTEEDEEWWYDDLEDDKEFDTDEDDENAEDYYANDYPEDEMDSDDEFDRRPYEYYHDENDDEYDLDDEVDDGEDMDFSQAVPKPKPVGFWGLAGEK